MKKLIKNFKKDIINVIVKVVRPTEKNEQFYGKQGKIIERLGEILKVKLIKGEQIIECQNYEVDEINKKEKTGRCNLCGREIAGKFIRFCDVCKDRSETYRFAGAMQR